MINFITELELILIALDPFQYTNTYIDYVYKY